MKKGIFYGWIICIFCLLLNFFTGGLTTVGFSVFAKPLQEAFGFTNTQTSMISTMRCLSSLILMPLVYKYYRKLSLRTGITIASAAIAAAYLIFSFSSTAGMFYVGAIIMGAAYSFGSTVPISLLIRNWFHASQSTAIGIAFCGSSTCTILMPIFAERVLQVVSVRTAFLIMTAVSVAFTAAVYLIVRSRPEDMGLHAYEKGRIRSEKERKYIESPMKSWQFALLLAAMFLAGGSGSPTSVHLPIHYATVGIPAVIAALGVSFYGIALTIGKVSQGFLDDRFGAFRMNFFFLGGFICGQFITAFLTQQSIPMMFFSAGLLGIGISVGTVGVIVWTGDLSSEKNYDRNITITQIAFSGGALLMTSLPGIIADATGSYRGGFLMFGCSVTVVLIIIQMLYLMRFRQRRS